MNYSMRWFGEQDEISLSDIRQAGAQSVVTALHQIPVGDVWTREEILRRKSDIEKAGLTWKVVESLPVHEDIKRRSGPFREYIDHYKISLQNLADAGLEVIAYNFMPALDWVRTDVSYPMESGAKGLRFEWIAYVCFDLFILKRPGAEKDYSSDDLEKAEKYFSLLSEKQIEKLSESCLMGLPGSTGTFSSDEVLKLLAGYNNISEEQLQDHLFRFLEEIAPVAESLNLKLAIHPDDPPFPVFGLPRIMSTTAHIQKLLETIPVRSSGLCLCTGSLGAGEDNDLLQILKTHSNRIHFLHLRSVQREGNKNFHEANHLEGSADLIALIGEISRIQENEQRSIPMRPDHGHLISAMDRTMYPGYSYIGRLKALAEIRGVEQTVLRLRRGARQ